MLFSEGHVHADSTSEEVITEGNIMDVYRVRSDVVAVDVRPYMIFHSDIRRDDVDAAPADVLDGMGG